MSATRLLSVACISLRSEFDNYVLAISGPLAMSPCFTIFIRLSTEYTVLYWKVTPEDCLVVCLDPEVDSARLLFLRSSSIFLLSQYILRQLSWTNCFSTTSISSCLSLLASLVPLHPFKVNWIVFPVARDLLQNTQFFPMLQGKQAIRLSNKNSHNIQLCHLNLH